MTTAMLDTPTTFVAVQAYDGTTYALSPVGEDERGIPTYAWVDIDTGRPADDETATAVNRLYGCAGSREFQRAFGVEA